MRRIKIVLVLTLLSNLLFGQGDTILSEYQGQEIKILLDTNSRSFKHFYSPFSNFSDIGLIIFGNPEILIDRTIWDANNRIIAKKVSSEYGYVYYEWRAKQNGIKTFEQIQFYPMHFKSTLFLNDSGIVNEQDIVTDAPYTRVSYFNDNLRMVEVIQIALMDEQADSNLSVLNIISSKIIVNKNTILWTKYNFHKNGNIKSTGLYITSNVEGIKNGQVGLWIYYDNNGKFVKETFTK